MSYIIGSELVHSLPEAEQPVDKRVSVSVRKGETVNVYYNLLQFNVYLFIGVVSETRRGKEREISRMFIII